MPTPPRQQFYNRLNKLHGELRRSRTNYRTICQKQRAGYAIDQIEQIIGWDISSNSAIFRAQKEVMALLTDVPFSSANLSDDKRPRLPEQVGLGRLYHLRFNQPRAYLDHAPTKG